METLNLKKNCFNYDSQYAHEIMDKLKQKKNIVWVYESLTADGYDSYGPQAILYQLYVITFDNVNSMYICDCYDTENWYDGSNSKVEYYLSNTYQSEEFYPVKDSYDLRKYRKK